MESNDEVIRRHGRVVL